MGIADQFPTGSIADYLGFPTDIINEEFQYSPFFFAAYRKIFDEYYRDQNLEPAETYVPLVSGSNNVTYGIGQLEEDVPLLRSLQHDYFTSCLPFAQKGDPISLPLTFQDNIPVEYLYGSGTTAEEVGLFRRADSGAIIATTGAVTNQAGPSPLGS